jgi:aspartate-semialdehyde dehydrogenase
MKEGLRVAVIGATGAVGKELLSILESRNFPVSEIIPFASVRSEGKPLFWKGMSYPCQVLRKGCFSGVDIAFFDASDAISQEWVPHATEQGAWVVDNSSTFRLEDDIPLLVPEVNGHQIESLFRSKTIKEFSPRERILSGPNCVAVPLVIALKPILSQWGIRRVVLSTYQATSGAGAAARDELVTQTTQFLNREKISPHHFAHQIAFNCIPHIGGFKEDGYTSEEQKIVAETQKILGQSSLKISATAVRVPTLSCHASSVNVECDRPFDLRDVRAALKAQPGLILQDDPNRKVYPLGMTSEGDAVESATGREAVYVGRVRQDPTVSHGLNLWVVADNLRKGAALNAVQVGEVLLKALLQ